MRRSLAALGFLSLLALTSPIALAERASLVADLEVRTGPNDSSGPTDFGRVGDRVVFFAGNAALLGGWHAWATDGTPEGTRRLPGEAPAIDLGLVGHARLWFTVFGSASPSLWATEGTAATTERLVDGGIDPTRGWSVEQGRLVFFRVRETLELWESDGSRSGTRRIASLPQVQDPPRAMAVWGDRIFFVTAKYSGPAGGEGDFYDWALWRCHRTTGTTRRLRGLPDFNGFHSAAHGLVVFADGRLWTSDGTRDGTRPVDGPPGRPDFRVTWKGSVVDGLLYFAGIDPRHGEALWVSDGTSAGTRILARGLSTGFYAPAPQRVGSRVLFVAADPEHGRELWSTRGLPGTTGLLADLCPGPCSSFADVFAPPDFVAAGERLYFLADDGAHGRELWVSDGTPGGTLPTLDLCPGPCGIEASLRSEGDEAFFYRRDTAGGRLELWASDGTAAGTRRLSDFPLVEPFLSEVSLRTPSLARLGDSVVTVGYDPRGGFEPWILDAAGGGGALLRDLDTGGQPGTLLRQAVAFGGELLFTGDLTLYSTGSAIAPTVLGHRPEAQFAAQDLIAVLGPRAYLNLGDLWVYDGTAGRPIRLSDLSSIPGASVTTAVAGLGDRAVFGVETVVNRETRLWTSDGTAAGTHEAAGLPAFHTLADLVSFEDAIFFWGRDLDRRWAIWTADPGLTGLRRLVGFGDQGPWLRNTVPPAFLRTDAGLTFLLFEDWDRASLWRTDRTPEGTERLRPLSSGGVEQQPAGIAAVRSTLVLATTGDARTDAHLWAGDGTPAGTVRLRDFGPGSRFVQMAAWEADVLVLVQEELPTPGPRLYRTDGTEAGTSALVDLAALGVTRAWGLTPVGDRLFFAAETPAEGAELWVSEGTAATTRRLQEIAPGPSGSDPEGFTVAGGRLYFSADDGLHGRELWSLPLADLDAPCRPSPTALCLGDGRFRAELFRHDRAGVPGDGRAVAWSSTAGAFWFYDYGNPESVVKLLDGRAVDDAFWLFQGPLTDAGLALTVTDLATGDARRYPQQAPGPLPAFADLRAFPDAGELSARAPEAEPLALAAPPVLATTPCAPSATRLCLQGGRFAAELAWVDDRGIAHAARAFAHGDRAGYFSFYGERDVQSALKLLDGRPIDGHFWLFATALTHLDTTLALTDTATGAVRTYPKPAGRIDSAFDLAIPD